MGLPGPIRPHLFPTRHRRRADSSSNILRPTIDFEDSTIEKAFVYQHDHQHDHRHGSAARYRPSVSFGARYGPSDSSPEEKNTVIEKAVLMTMVEAILKEVER